MPKKRTSKRLDKLFEGIEEEAANPSKKDGIKTAPRPFEKKPATKTGRPATKSSTRASGLAQTGVLPPLESVAMARRGNANTPSSMSLAFQMDSRNWATLQVVDETAVRNWDQDEQMLVKQVADQLSQALENARLFQETRSRAEELAVLNEMGRELTTLLNVESIAETIYKYASRLMDTTNLFVSLYDETKQEVTPLFVINERERVQVPPRKLGKGLSDFILRTSEPLFIPENVPGRMKELGIEVVLIADDRLAQCWLGTPLLVGNSVLGVVGVQSVKAPNLYNEHHRDLLMAISSQAAIAIQNARLFEETQRRTEELGALNELNQKLSARLDMNQVLQEIYRGVERLIDAKNFYIGLYSPETNEVSFPLNVSESVIDKEITVIRADQGMSGYLLRSRTPLLIRENVAEGMRKLGIEVVGQPAESWLGVPLLLGEQVIGVMAVQSYSKPNVYDEHDQDLLMAVAGQAAISIQNARLFKEAQQRTEELGTLNRIASSTSQILDTEPLLNSVLLQTLDILGFSGGLVSLYEENKKQLALITHHSLPQPVRETLETKGFGNSLCEYVYLTQKVLAITDLREGSPTDPRGLIASGILSYLGIPLEAKGKTIGTLCMFNEKPIQVETRLVDLARSIGIQIGFAVENAQLFERTQASETELRALFAAMTDVIIVYDKEGRYKRIAPTNPSRLFLPPESMLEKKVEEVLPPEVSDTLMTAIEKSLKTGETTNIEYPLQIDQNEYWFDGSISKLSEQEVFLVARDITDRKQAESDLLKFKLGIDQSTDAVFITDTSGIITYANPGFEKIYGFSHEEAIGQNPRIIKSGLLSKETYEQFWGVLLSKQTVSGEIVNKAKDGRLVYIAGTNSPILDAQGKILGFLAVHHDISDLKQAEEVLKRRNEYLSATAEIGRLVTSTLDLPTLFSRTVNLVRDRFGFYHAGIFVTEETGFRAILQEATGDAGAEMLRQKHGLQVGAKSIVGEVTESGRPVVVNDTAASSVHKFNPLLPETRAEAAIPLRVGTRIIGALDIQSTHPNAFSEDDIAVLQTLSDQIAIAIDNARSYELSMQAVKEMREADKLKSQFLANMSHELRTPLNSIIGFSRVILKGIDGPVTDLQQQDLLAIHNSGQHLLGLINDILDLSRIEAGKMELSFDEVNLPELIASVMSTVTGLVKDKHITLHRELPDNLPTVRADAMRIRQVLLNLLSNAAKFTDEGSITVKASAKKSPSGHPEITVSVTDTGPGISPEDQKKLFQAFSQVDASATRKSGGSGLGLSISNHLIQMHGGKIGVESASGAGSTFYFSLPAFRGKDSPDFPQGNRIVLAIEDDPQVIHLYERYLQPQGYQVIALSDPSRAVERVRQLKPFAVTLDIMMPGYDGWHVLTDLKSDSATRDVPVIVCSIIEEQDRGFSLGAADYLVKPILEDDLLDSLDRLNADGRIREVLIIDDDPNDLRLIDRMLSEHGRYRPNMAEGGRNGWEAIQSHTPHAVILDLFMPDLDGFTILERMRSNERLRDVPIIVVSGGDLSAEQQKQLQEFGQRLIQKSTLNERQLIETLENALKRIKN